MTWNDFNTAEDPQDFDVIPKNTLAKMRMSIRPGGYTDINNAWDNGYATQSESSDAVYLDCEFVVLEGPFARRKIWTMIGLYSPKGPKWTNMGRSFIKAILHSARGISPKDTSPQAQQARQIHSLGDLDGVEFIGRIGIESDNWGEPKNVVKSAITPDHKEYVALMRGQTAIPESLPQQCGVPTSTPYAQPTTYTSQPPVQQRQPPSTQQHQAPQSRQPQRQPASAHPQSTTPSGRPSWAQ